jgi:hypothetical protein
MAGYSQLVAIVRLVIPRALKVEGFPRVSGSSESMKQVYYRYLDCLNRNCLLYISLAPSPRRCMISSSHQTFKHSVASMMSSCRLFGLGKQLLRTGKDSLAQRSGPPLS